MENLHNRSRRSFATKKLLWTVGFIVCTLINATSSQVVGTRCDIPKCLEKNTYCLYPDEKGANCTADFGEEEGHPTFAEVVLHEHNLCRSEVAMGKIKDKNQRKFPYAANMMQLEYDEGLADLAGRWLKQCSNLISHDKCRSTEKFSSAGQNLAWRSLWKNSFDKTHIKMVRAWHDEYLLYNTKKDLRPQGSATGHFTALAWAKTTHVGCSQAAGTPESLKFYYLYCDYGPAGNTLGNDMYIKGKPCTKCPAGTSCSKKYVGLCTGGPDAGADPPDVAKGHCLKENTVVILIVCLLPLIFTSL